MFSLTDQGKSTESNQFK